MSPQEIFQNMTKGEWEMSNILGVMCNGKVIDDKQMNGHAAVLAVNNTFGKGINPEGVEGNNRRLERSLHIIQELLNYLPDKVDGVDLSPLKLKSIKFTNEVEEAIQTAKLPV